MVHVRKTTDKADMLNELESAIREIADGLDDKAKAFIGVLSEIQSVGYLSIGVDYGDKIVFDELGSEDFVKTSLQKLEAVSDSDVVVLKEAYDLASFINQENN